MTDDRRAPFGLLPPPDPRTLHDGHGTAMRPGGPGWEGDLPVGKPSGLDAAMRGANMQQLRMMIARDPSLLWGKGDAMNPADRGQMPTSDPIPNYAYPTSDGGNLPDTGMAPPAIPNSSAPGFWKYRPATSDGRDL